MTEPPRQPRIHPREYRRPIVAVAQLAMATWWGIGLPYSLFAWLLDATQRSWTLVCYLWEVPIFGLVGLVLIPRRLWRDIEERWAVLDGIAPAMPARDVAQWVHGYKGAPLEASKDLAFETL